MDAYSGTVPSAPSTANSVHSLSSPRVPSPWMNSTPDRNRNLYVRRRDKEKAISEEEITARMRWDLPVLSSNSKCSISLNLPIQNCLPTAACASVCYASQGFQYLRKSIVKSLAVNRMIQDDPERVARKMVDEAAGRNIRLAGSGEILPSHKDLLSYIENFGGTYWGFTRRIDTHKTAPSLMFSIDATTPTKVMDYVRNQVPANRRAYLRRPRDPPSPIEVSVTFPVHGHLTNYTEMTPLHETDCPVDRKRVDGCWSCKRCY